MRSTSPRPRSAISLVQTAREAGLSGSPYSRAGCGLCRRVAAERDSAEAAIEPVAGAEIAPDPRHEPSVAVIERMAWEFVAIEGADAVDLACDLAAGLEAQIAQHGDAGAVAAQGVVEIVELAHMRHLVD